MNERQPCGIRKAHAYALIQAMKVRPLLPEFPGLPETGTWTETSIRPLLHKDFKPNDQKRIGKKCLALEFELSRRRDNLTFAIAGAD